MRTVVRGALVLGVVVAFAVGCSKKTSGPPTITQPTKEQATAFAVEIAKTLDPCDNTAFAALYDLDKFTQASIAGLPLPAADRRQARIESNDAIKPCFEIGPYAGTPLTFLRVHMVDGAPRPLFRMLYPGGGVNYVEFVLHLDGDKVRIADTYSYVAGNLVSESLRSLYAHVKDPSVGQRLARLGDALQQDDRATAREVIASLPADLRATKHIRVMELDTVDQDDNATYAAKLEAYRKDFPDDPTLDLKLIDAEYLKGDHVALGATIDRFERLIGGDPYLDVIRAMMALEAHDHDAAAGRAQRAVDADPTLADGWRMLIAAHAMRGDVASSVIAIDQMRTRRPALQESMLTDLDVWSEVQGSKEYAAWKRGEKLTPSKPLPPIK
jgi:hypothetical protein